MIGSDVVKGYVNVFGDGDVDFKWRILNNFLLKELFSFEWGYHMVEKDGM